MGHKDSMNKEPDFKKVLQDYQGWIDKTTLAPTKAVYFVGFVAVCINGILVRNHNEGWYVQPILLIAIGCFCILVRKEGHKEGYIAGYESGYGQGKDDALGIDDDMREFIDEGKRDNYIKKIIKNISENKSQ